MQVKYTSIQMKKKSLFTNLLLCVCNISFISSILTCESVFIYLINFLMCSFKIKNNYKNKKTFKPNFYF